jgi:hypothetical protein
MKSEATMKTGGPVMVIYEDSRSRKEALQFCDQLMARFWSRAQFEIFWFSFTDLQDETAFQSALSNMVKAGLIMFAMVPEGRIPAPVREHLEMWLKQRGEREGTIIGVQDPGGLSEARMSDKYLYLRDLAHRAGMDYLTQLPDTISHPIPDSFESYSQRADQVTTVLDQILHKPIAPPRLAS